MCHGSDQLLKQIWDTTCGGISVACQLLAGTDDIYLCGKASVLAHHMSRQ